MPDNKKIKGPEDQRKINVNEPYELRDWSKRLGVTPQELVKVVGIVGPGVDDVRRHFEKK